MEPRDALALLVLDNIAFDEDGAPAWVSDARRALLGGAGAAAPSPVRGAPPLGDPSAAALLRLAAARSTLSAAADVLERGRAGA
jgi:hypothetical protein